MMWGLYLHADGTEAVGVVRGDGITTDGRLHPATAREILEALYAAFPDSVVGLPSVRAAGRFAASRHTPGFTRGFFRDGVEYVPVEEAAAVFGGAPPDDGPPCGYLNEDSDRPGYCYCGRTLA